MGNLFNMEGGLMTALSKLFDICFLSILWFFCSVPVITIGASTTALYYGVVKVIRHERGYIGREFFRAFKSNFVNGTIMWVIVALATMLLYGNMKLAAQIGGNQGVILISIYRAMSFILFCTTVYIFPNLSRFTMGKKQLIKTSFLMSMKHLPSTVCLVALVFATIFAVYIVPITILFLPALSCLLFSFLMERILKKYMPEQEENADNSSDQWYLE